MDTDGKKEVLFDQYCLSCKFAHVSEGESPCWECLDEPYNTYSHKPVMYKEATN